MRTVCNPFLFIVQIISLLPPVRAGCSGSCGTTLAAHDCDSSVWHAPELRASSPWENLSRHSSTACAMDHWQTAARAPLSAAISSRPAVISTIGHGGCTSMRTVCNPFLFIVQVLANLTGRFFRGPNGAKRLRAASQTVIPIVFWVAYSSGVLSTDHAVNYGIIVDVAEGFTGNSEKICEALNWEPLTPTAAESDMCPAAGFTGNSEKICEVLNGEPLTPTAAESDMCPATVYEPWFTAITALQKTIDCSASLGRGTGSAMAVPFTHVLLLVQSTHFEREV